MHDLMCQFLPIFTEWNGHVIDWLNWKNGLTNSYLNLQKSQKHRSETSHDDLEDFISHKT